MPAQNNAIPGDRSGAGASTRGDAATMDARAVPRRHLLLWAALAYLAFVIYGSLVPLAYQPRPLPEAWALFRDIRHFELGIGSRADWVANILLFVPLAYLWLGALWPGRSRMAGALVSVLVLFVCIALSWAIEFAQLFFPPRTVSLNDIVAEATGAVIGVTLWWATGRRVVAWLGGWADAHGRASTARRFLHAYLALVFGYSVLPLDLTISVVEIYHKWQEGKVLLVPFSAVYESGALRAYALLADIAIWIPAAFLWQLSSSRPGRRVVLNVLACAAAIEVLQLFVYSRVTSTTDLLTAACGGTIGVLLARRLRPEVGDLRLSRATTSGGMSALYWVLAVTGWMGVLMVVFWYPFNFSNDWGFVHGRLAGLKRVPFEAYYYGTEFRAVTEVFHKTGFFFPLGALLALGAIAVRRRFPVPALLLHVASALVGAGAAAGIEMGQLFLPGKVADATDWVLATLGVVIGYSAVWILSSAWSGGRGGGVPNPNAVRAPVPPDAPMSRR